MTERPADAAAEKMRSRSIAQVAIDTFRHNVEVVESGGTGYITESSIRPAGKIVDLDDIDALSADSSSFDRVAVVKLNGGLGTSMGMTAPKSLIEVKSGHTFLDIIVGQTLAMRRRYGARVPLILMNSAHTSPDSTSALERYPEIESDVPVEFVQSEAPKISRQDLMPVEWPRDRRLEWAPPGHGGIYTALVSTGILETLVDRGYRYGFVSNADNLGAVVDPRILGWLDRHEHTFLMEVATRTESDRKGGHLARDATGRLVLRESAQCAPEDVGAFGDIDRYRYFNTNNIWLRLDKLADVLDARGGVLGLPVIANPKTVDPTDPSSPAVLQLESAMGSAISVFDDSAAIHVPRYRFAPVKTTNDLLRLRSDAYELTDDYRIVRASGHGRDVYVDLDERYYKMLADFDARFDGGVPSLTDCDRVIVRGDVKFGADIRLVGDVEVVNSGETQIELAADITITNEVHGTG